VPPEPSVGAWYDDWMKTVVIADEPLPKELRDVIARGSTSIEERRSAEETSAAMPDADRIVFWSKGADQRLEELARRYATVERAGRREVIVFVTTKPGDPMAGLSSIEWFVWPQDEDRLRMAFMTGA
jgi:hypothetical protein